MGRRIAVGQNVERECRNRSAPVLLTSEAKDQLNVLKVDKGLSKRYKAVKKALQFLSQNPRHPGLRTHEFTTSKAQKVKKSFEAYAEQATPAAYRIFWYYGPKENQITIIAITPHPEDRTITCDQRL